MTENSSETQGSREFQERIKKALELAVQFGGIDGDHHKAWVIDQMVRVLTGCPTIQLPLEDGSLVDDLGESGEYRELVRAACEGEDGPETYDWDIGVAP